MADPDTDIPDMCRLRTAFTAVAQQAVQADVGADTSLATALSFLIKRLTQPLSTSIPDDRLDQVRESLREVLHAKFEPTWDEEAPQKGSGYRSLICTKYNGLPAELRQVATQHGINQAQWIQSLSTVKRRDGSEERISEWEAWCDPGLVSWRYGPWEYEDIGFEPSKLFRDPISITWKAPTAKELQAQAEAAAAFTPARPSHAIPIRAPSVLRIPPTPSQVNEHPSSPSGLLPAASIAFAAGQGRTGPNAFSSPESDEDEGQRRGRLDPALYGGEPLPRLEYGRQRETSEGRHRHGHSGSHSTSSVDSALSDTNSGLSQLMTPGSRPESADIFQSAAAELRDALSVDTAKSQGRTPSPTTPHANQRDSTTPATVTGATPAQAQSTTPTITPYDGGNVTVLGGGVRLGGSSRPSSVMSAHRTPIDRSRSPSISLPSRALNSAVGPGGGNRKTRTRRRIMPTYLGSIHQPGVGGPINGVFSQFSGPAPAPGSGPGAAGQQQQQGYLPAQSVWQHGIPPPQQHRPVS